MNVSVEDVVREALKLPADHPLSDESRPGTVPGWDSMGWIHILNLTEERLDVQLAIDQVADCECLGDLRRLVERAAA